MSKPSWESAPVWATVMLQHRDDDICYAFAKSYSAFAKVSRVGRDSTFALDPTCWTVVEERPNPDITAKPLLWDGENWLSVGDYFTLSHDEDKCERHITYIGSNFVCYMLMGTENAVTRRYLESRITPSRELRMDVITIQNRVEDILGKRPSYESVIDLLEGLK